MLLFILGTGKRLLTKTKESLQNANAKISWSSKIFFNFLHLILPMADVLLSHFQPMPQIDLLTVILVEKIQPTSPDDSQIDVCRKRDISFRYVRSKLNLHDVTQSSWSENKRRCFTKVMTLTLLTDRSNHVFSMSRLVLMIGCFFSNMNQIGNQFETYFRNNCWYI